LSEGCDWIRNANAASLSVVRTWLDAQTLPDGLAGASPVFYGNITCFEKNCHGDGSAMAQCAYVASCTEDGVTEADSPKQIGMPTIAFMNGRTVTQDVVARRVHHHAHARVHLHRHHRRRTGPHALAPPLPTPTPPPLCARQRRPAPRRDPRRRQRPPPTPLPTPFVFRTDEPTLLFTPPPTPVDIGIPTTFSFDGGVTTTATTTTTTNNDNGPSPPGADQSSGSDSTVGIIVGAAVGGIVCIGCALLIAFLFLRNSRKKALLQSALSADAAYLSSGNSNQRQFGGTPMSAMEPMESARNTSQPRSTQQTRSTAVSSTSDMQPYAQPYGSTYASSSQYQQAQSPYAGTAYSSETSTRTSIPYIPEPRTVPSHSDYKLLSTGTVAPTAVATNYKLLQAPAQTMSAERVVNTYALEDGENAAESTRYGELQLKPYATSAYSSQWQDI
jgi:hypothetical protein